MMTPEYKRDQQERNRALIALVDGVSLSKGPAIIIDPSCQPLDGLWDMRPGKVWRVAKPQPYVMRPPVRANCVGCGAPSGLEPACSYCGVPHGAGQ